MKMLAGLKKHVMDEIYESSGEEPPSFFDQLRIDMHLFFCQRCSDEVKKIELAREIMKFDFFPPHPDLEQTVMESISTDEEEFSDVSGHVLRNHGVVSTRGWIITGCFMALSLATVFFTLDLLNVVDTASFSFLLPIGLTIGLILTGYIAVFTGTHLKELVNRFGPH